MSSELPADLRAAAALGGEMGRRFAEFDWARHPLGDPRQWTPTVRGQVAAALASRFPTVLWLGDQLRLVYNDAYIPLLGDKHPAALGRPGAQAWWDIWDVIGPMLEDVTASGKATWSSDLLLALVNDGRRRERYFTFTYSPILGADGRIEGVFCPVTETTERVVGEQRLQALSALSGALLNTSSAGAVQAATIRVCAAHDADLPFAAVYRTDGTDGDLDEARPYLATPSVAGMLPERLASLLAGADVASAAAGSAAAASAAEGVGYLASGIDARVPGLRERFGERCPRQALVLPVSQAADGEPGAVLVLGLNSWRPLDEQYRGFCGLLADQVTGALASARAYEDERRRAEALAELDRAKTTFLANVSHEFRTPLTLMLGSLDDILDTAPPGDDGATERLEMIRRNGWRLLRLVNSLLEFSRIEAGRASPVLAMTDIGTLTAGVASTFADVCRLAGISLITRCRPAWGQVDLQMWETITANLVSNAFKHTFTGSVTVAAGPAPDGGIEMTVTDTGTGVAAEDLPHLFERFYRAASSTGRSAEGSGIGLALVKSLVEMHDGTITIDSAPDAGTTVTVRLPPTAVGERVPEAGLIPPVASGTADAYVNEARQWVGVPPGPGTGVPPGPGTGGPGRALVLVADDNADMRAHLARVLRSRWEVATASDGRQALDLARRMRPDLLVTDVMMPALDGFELVTTIRADPELRHLPVIMLSARAGVEAAGEGLAAGADSYLIKPFASADLVNQVAARLEAAGRDRSRPGSLPARKDQALAELAAALAAARSPRQALETLLASPLCCLEAGGAAVGVLDESQSLLRVTFAGDMRPDIIDRYHLVNLNSPLPLADVIHADAPMVVPDTARLGPRYARVAAEAAARPRAAILHPLHADDGSLVGVAWLSWPVPREFSHADVDITERAATLLARAMTRILAAEREHQIAMALQERLLDLGPGTPAAAVAASYQPAGEALRVGGDWYTATPIDDHRIGVSVGDVAGHGLPAAAVMSQLRSALSTAALAEAEPNAVLGLVDRYARTVPGAMFATAAYAVVDSQAGTVEYTCAGHPYPLVVAPDGSTRHLTGGRRVPLGGRSATADPATGRTELPAGSLLLLYTDGLIERRDEPIDVGLARLATAAAGCAQLPAGVACARLLEAMAGPDGYTDDVAMVAVRPRGTTTASHVDALPAARDEMAAARDRLGSWLSHVTPGPAQAERVLRCAIEAIANAIEHGSERDPDRIVTIEAFATADAITVTISDTGRWVSDSSAGHSDGRGQGLTLMHSLADHVHAARTPQGTRLTITCDLPQPR